MRTIKFRGKSALNGKWLFGYLSWYQEEDSGRFINGKLVDSGTVGQFIGLYDIEGKEIYEGDIVEDNRGNKTLISYVEEFSAFHQVLYPSSIIEFLGTKSLSKEFIEEAEVKVIGNSYETM